MIYTLKEKTLMKTGFITGALVGFLLILIMLVTPSKPHKTIHSSLYSTMIGLELSRSEEDISSIVGPKNDPLTDRNLEGYLQSLELDYSFIFFYSLFFLSIFEASFRMNKSSVWIRVVFYLSIIVTICCDILENLLLAEVLNSYSTKLSENYLQNLFPISYTKWLMIYISIFICGIQTWFGSRFYLMKLGSISFVIPLLLSLFSYNRLFLLEAGFVISFPGLFMYWGYFGLKVLKKESSS